MLLTAAAAVLMLGSVVQASVFSEDFSDASALDDWIFYKDYGSDRWTITASNEVSSWEWGSNKKTPFCMNQTDPT